MSEQMKAAVVNWAESAQRTGSRSALRGAHRLNMTEPGSRQTAIQLPPELADRIREQHILNQPDVAEGFEHAKRIIEGWKQSL